MTLEELNTERQKYIKAMQDSYDNTKRLEGVIAYIDTKIKEIKDKETKDVNR
jgi:hypothetical protein